MSGFSAQWLALREPYDRKARSPAVLDALARAFADHSSIGVVDLACGTGATLRAISPRLPPRQDWRLVDNDLGLLARAADLARPPSMSVSARAVDLARDLELALDGPTDLITTSALLDLVSRPWMDRLAIEAAARRLPVYAALTYNGVAELSPAEALDTGLIAALNAHQHTDKGFGPALGPDAGNAAVQCFARVGYSIQQRRSDWILGPTDHEIQLVLLAGWAGATQELGDLTADEITAWLAQRRAHVTAGSSRMRIGHTDMFAAPIGIR